MKDKETMMLEDQKRRERERKQSAVCRMAGNIAAGLVGGENTYNLTFLRDHKFARLQVAEVATEIAFDIYDAVRQTLDGEESTRGEAAR